MTKKAFASSARAKPAAKTARHRSDRRIDFSDIPQSMDEELRRARRVGRPKTGKAKQLIAIRIAPPRAESTSTAARMYTQHRSHFPEQRATVSCVPPTKFANDSRNEPAALPLFTTAKRNRAEFNTTPSSYRSQFTTHAISNRLLCNSKRP